MEPIQPVHWRWTAFLQCKHQTSTWGRLLTAGLVPIVFASPGSTCVRVLHSPVKPSFPTGKSCVNFTFFQVRRNFLLLNVRMQKGLVLSSCTSACSWQKMTWNWCYKPPAFPLLSRWETGKNFLPRGANSRPWVKPKCGIKVYRTHPFVEDVQFFPDLQTKLCRC